MDDLDRLYHHLVDSLRHEAPHLLRQRFSVGDLTQQLVPYRLHRRGLGFDAIQQYDLAVLRLVSGERGYLATEPVVQDAARQALSGPQPELDAIRRFADAPAALAPEPLRSLLGDLPPDGAHRPPPPPGMTGSTPTALHPGFPPGPPVGPPPVGAIPPAPLAGAAAATSVPDRPPQRATEPALGAMASRESPPVRPEPSAMPFPTRPPTPVLGGRCQYCGQALPEGRAVTFCPHCGQNVTIVRCPACSTELEAGWRFCVTCGRVMDSAAPAG
ncbi:MAG: double zinc ribbon domain-containing protein [Gemmatirosa sp.]